MTTQAEQSATEAQRIAATIAGLEFNKDGSCIVTLRTPVAFEGEECGRITLPALKGKHLMSAPWADDAKAGDMATFASRIAQPKGLFEELGYHDAERVVQTVVVMVGKSRAAGGPTSTP